MKDGEKTYSTSQIAGIVGLHPNTVRKYEEWGLLQTPECISSSVFPKNRKEKFPILGMGYSHISAGNIFI